MYMYMYLRRTVNEGEGCLGPKLDLLLARFARALVYVQVLPRNEERKSSGRAGRLAGADEPEEATLLSQS